MLTKCHCEAEAKRLHQKGDTKRLSHVLYAYCINNQHVTQAVDTVLRAGIPVNGIQLREIAAQIHRKPFQEKLF